MLLQYTFKVEEKILESVNSINGDSNEHKKILNIDEVITSDDEETFLYGDSNEYIIGLVRFFLHNLYFFFRQTRLRQKLTLNSNY